MSINIVDPAISNLNHSLKNGLSFYFKVTLTVEKGAMESSTTAKLRFKVTAGDNKDHSLFKHLNSAAHY